MRILCLCPTYGRPRLLANAIACFEAQDHQDRFLLALDDAGQIEPQTGDRFRILSVPNRYQSLPAKYNALLNYAGGSFDAVAVWDDDDIYLPWHLTSVSLALANGAPSCKPREVWSLYRPPGVRGEGPWREIAAGRFHGSLAVSRSRLEAVGGWIQTRRADFDQQQIMACAPAVDSLNYSPERCPGYVFRWGSTGAPHCQHLMTSPCNESWYDRYQQADKAHVQKLVPRFDPETTRIYGQFAEVAAMA
jgi:hypothetical protein